MSRGIPSIHREAGIVVCCAQTWPGYPGCPELVQLPGPRTYCFDGCTFAVTDLGGEGKVLLGVLDLARADGKAVKWRDVEKACSLRVIKPVPIAWRGPGREAPGDLLDSAPYVAFRLMDRGPWMLVRWAEEPLNKEKEEGACEETK
jgi:hypothetical protein